MRSKLWPSADQSWHSRLPDFSFAGYRFGEAQPPTVPVAADVKHYGAVGDGKTDDSDAFLAALAAVKSGAVFVPPGRYLIRKILWIEKSNVVLRGAGRDDSVLVFDTPLQVVRPDMSATTNGRPTSNYSWAGGFVWIKGQVNKPNPRKITSEAKRRDTSFTVDSAAGLKVGQRVIVQVFNDPDHTLISHIYNDDPGPIEQMKKRNGRTSIVSRIAAIDGNRVTLERQLRFDLRPAWKPTLSDFEPTVTESGVEELGFEFPVVPYGGHFNEQGFNAIAMNGCSDCWSRNIRITNCDSGIYLTAYFCSAYNTLIDSVRPDFQGDNGHHGIQGKEDCLFDGFDIRTRFIHDITVDHWATGNVFKNGRGKDLAFDHHRDGPYENLFCNIDTGAGSQVWRCGGGQELGRHTGAYATFWNIRAAKPQTWPKPIFGPALMNLVGVQTDSPAELTENGRWFEPIPPAELDPQDLHAAQLAKRLGQRNP